jgi:hypothetical protein
MSDLSLRSYVQLQNITPACGVRDCCAPSMKNRKIRLRSLMTAPRVIHISDLHFTNASSTWDWSDDPIGHPVRDSQNSPRRRANLSSFLISKKDIFGTNIIVITGDITDSGGNEDYNIATAFINDLESAGFEVYTVPGNHDYCWEGNLFIEDIFKISKAEVIAAITAGFFTGKPPDVALTELLIVKLISLGFPPDVAISIASIFTITATGIVITTDTADNHTRRQRFIDNITHYDSYPQEVPITNGYLILLDSMKDELDGKKDLLSQGRLGTEQLDALDSLLQYKYNDERNNGKKVIVCLHHSPFKKDGSGGLDQADDFIKKLSMRIDGLLFGHTTPEKTVFQQPRLPPNDSEWDGYMIDNHIPLINCENLEHVPEGEPYPITVLDFGSYRRLVYWTNGSIDPSWGFLTG